uniref:hypothetical protein n=1 Tax=Treponema endosymbiont of Eucomonympha sp. TaxID=1580831 RepID=UPI000AC0B48F
LLDEKLVPKIIKSSDDEIKVPTKLPRSLDEKYQYFQNHSIQKATGFELHHVVPLAWSENIHQFKLLDKWLNMVYIDGFSHGKITQNNNRNVVMENDAATIILSDYTKNKIILEFRKNVVYSYEKVVNMLDYNKELLKMY